MNSFQRWMSKNHLREKKKLARAARTTVGTLIQMAGAYRSKGKVRVRPELARKIEIASKGKFKRETLCPACNRCELASKARKG